jgi:hypothetical protein
VKARIIEHGTALLNATSVRSLRGIATRFDPPGLRARVALFVTLCGMAAGLVLLALPGLTIGPAATIKIDMDVSAGDSLALFVNAFDRAPRRVGVVPGSRRVYAFGGFASEIRVMRFDLSERKDATITVHSVEVVDEDGLLKRFAPADIARWNTTDLRLVEANADFARFVSTGSNPHIQTGDAVPLRRSLPSWLSGLVADSTSHRFFVPIVLVGFLLILAATALEAQRPEHLVLALSTTLAVMLLVPWLTVAAGGLSSLAHTVGRAAFFGTSTRGNVVATLVMTLLSVGLAASVIWLRPTLRPAPDTGTPPLPRAVSILCLCIVLLIAVPDIGRILQDSTTRAYRPDWDSNNIVVWNWLAHAGYLPMRDYWYPYGGYYLFELPAPWGLLLWALYRCWVFASLYVALDRLTGRPLAVCAFTLFVFIGDGLAFPGVWRFLLVVLVALSYLTISSRHDNRGRAFFWLTCAIVGIIEPVQLVSAGVAVGLIFALDVYQGRDWTFAAIGDRLLRDFGVPAAVLAFYVLLLLIAGQGRGLLDFYGNLGDATVYSAEPADLAGAARNPLSVQFLILATPFAALAIGLADRWRTGRPDPFADSMIALGVVGIMMLQKHLVRPMDWQLFVVPCLIFAVYLIFWWGRVSLVGQALVGVTLGVAFAVLVQNGGLISIWYAGLNGPSRLASSLGVLLAPGNRVVEGNAQKYAPARFAALKEETALAAELSKPAAGSAPPDFFVLGDSPILYLLAGRKPPYHVNDYNSSPIYEQAKLADYIDRAKPPTVVWDPNTQSFDLFQSVLRNPLTYGAVIPAYVPDHRSGRYEVLRRRAAGEPVALDFWRDRLGSQVNYGHFARASSFPRLAPCKVGASECREFLRVTKRKPEQGGKLVVAVTLDGRPFQIAMETVPGDRVLYVALDRLWFWGPMRAAGLTSELDPAASSPDIDLAIERTVRRPDVLY